MPPTVSTRLQAFRSARVLVVPSILLPSVTILPRQLSSARKGFTLAEFLITLGIIGIVAAMTIPNLITAHQKKVTVTKLQKAISVLNQSYKLANEELSPPPANMPKKEYFKTYWAPYLKASYCDYNQNCGYKSNYPFRYLSGAKSYAALLNTRITGFMTSDGFFVGIQDSGTGYLSVNLDINGPSLPNKLGQDVFSLIAKDGVVSPNCYESSNSYVNAYCTQNTNSCCAEKIRRAGWEIDKSYPWK